jgi:hypothetical protein
VQDGSNATLLPDAHSLGTVSIEVDGAGPRPGDDAGGPLCDLVVCGTSLGMSGSIASGDVIPTLSPRVAQAQG